MADASVTAEWFRAVDAHRLAKDELTERTQARLGEQQDKTTNGMIVNQQKALDPNLASARTPYGQGGQALFQADRTLALLEKPNLTNEEWTLVGEGLNRLISGGVPASRMIVDTLPKDIEKSYAGIRSWLTSEPAAPERQAWVDRFKDTLAREEKTAKNLVRQTQLRNSGMLEQIEKRRPGSAAQILMSYPELTQPNPLGHIDPTTYRVMPGTKDPAAGPQEGDKMTGKSGKPYTYTGGHWVGP